MPNVIDDQVRSIDTAVLERLHPLPQEAEDVIQNVRRLVMCVEQKLHVFLWKLQAVGVEQIVSEGFGRVAKRRRTLKAVVPRPCTRPEDDRKRTAGIEGAAAH